MGVVVTHDPTVVSGMQLVVDVREVIAGDLARYRIDPVSRRNLPLPRLSEILWDSSMIFMSAMTQYSVAACLRAFCRWWSSAPQRCLVSASPPNPTVGVYSRQSWSPCSIQLCHPSYLNMVGFGLPCGCSSAFAAVDLTDGVRPQSVAHLPFSRRPRLTAACQFGELTLVAKRLG